VGLFKNLRNARDLLYAAPGVVERPQRPKTGSARHAAKVSASASAPAADVAPADLEPIAGVTLETYARICKQAAAGSGDEDGLLSIARAYRVDAASWRAASEGWSGRFRGNVPLALHYGDLYRAA
jgi:hypothetical protein